MEDATTTSAVVAVTSNPSLVIGLIFLGRAWDVASQAGVDDLPHADVLVIDLGTSSVAVEVLHGLTSPRPPAVVIGDTELEVPEGDRLLLRPFTLDALADEIDAALSPAGVSDIVEAGEGSAAEEAPTTERSERPRGRRGRRNSPDEEPPQQDQVNRPAVFIQLPTSWETDASHVEVLPEPEVAAGAACVTGPEEARVLGVVERDHGCPIRDRLTAALATGSELEQLVTDVPMIRSMRGLARAVVAEARDVLEADTVGFWQRTDDGFRAVASIGLTAVATRRLVELDQPMMAEVDGSGGGLLIDPVEYAQAAVTGIGGAHTASFMVASIAAGSERFGLISVGRDDPLTPDDLDRLIDLAAEAAPGVGVAQLLERLGGGRDAEHDETALDASPSTSSRGEVRVPRQHAP
jgi:hypothetical protein